MQWTQLIKKQNEGQTLKILVQFFVQAPIIIPIWLAGTEDEFLKFATYKWRLRVRKDDDIQS